MGEVYATTFHRDGTVTVWDSFKQAWQHRCRCVSDQVLATLPRRERERVQRHLMRARLRSIGNTLRGET